MLKKMLLISALIITSFASAVQAASVKLMLTASEAPFAPKKVTAVSQKGTKPRVEGHVIKAGNKELQVSPDGVAKLFCNGRLIAKIFMWLNTQRGWFPIASTIATDKKASYNPETKTFFYSGKVALNKENSREISFSRSISLLPDGRVKFHYTWDTPAEDQDIKASGIAVQLTTSDNSTKTGVDGKVYLPEGGRIFYKSNPEKLDLLLGNPVETFAIMPKSLCYVTGTFRKTNKSSEEKVAIKLDPGSKAKELSFLMSFGNISKEVKAPHKYAGIDFYALDKLEMPDYRMQRNLFQNPSFEQGMRYFWASFLYFGSYPSPEKWNDAFLIDDKVAKFGEKSLKIKTWSANKPRSNSNLYSGYITSMPIPLEPGKYTLSFYAKGDRPVKQMVSVFMPQVHWQKSSQLALPGSEKMKMGVPVTSDWTRHSFTVYVDKSIPARVAFGACSDTSDGHVWIDGVQLEKGTKLTDFQPPAVEGVLATAADGNFIQSAHEIDATLSVFAKPDTSGAVEVEVKNFFGEQLFSDTFRFKCNDKGIADLELPFNNKFDQGIYVVSVVYNLADGQQKTDYYRFSIMEKLRGDERLKRMFASNYGRHAHNHIFPKILKRNVKVGLRSRSHLEYRMDHVINEYEKNDIVIFDSWMAKKTPINGRDRGSFTIKDGFFFGKTLIDGFLKDNPSGELTDDYLKKFKQAVKKCAELNPKIRRWSLFGEAFCWFPEMCALDAPDELYNKYIRLQLAFYEAIKEFDPTLEVTNGDPPNMSQVLGVKLLERQLAATKGKIKYDHIGIHPYRKSPDNSDLDADTEALLKMLKRYGYDDTPVFWPEGMHYGPYNIPQWDVKSAAWTPNSGCWYYGALSYDMGWTEKLSAAWRMRTWLVALKYQDRISSAVSAHGHNNFIIDYELTPFATQKVPHTLTRLLGDAEFRKDIRFAPNTSCYIFENKDRCPVAVVWGNHPKLENGTIGCFIVEVDLPDKDIEVFDMMEQKRQLQKEKIVRFPVTPFPLFFKGQAGELDNFIKIFSNASLVSGKGLISPLALSGVPISAASIELTVENQLSRPFNGNIVAGDLKQKVELKPLSSQSYVTTLPTPLKKGEIIKEKVNVSVIEQASTKAFNTDVQFRGFLCGRTKTPISIDGKLDDWQNIPKISLINRYKRRVKKGKSITDDDFSGWFKVVWNESGVYLCVKVNDDQYFNKIDPEKRPSERWNNDSLQVFFDSLGDGMIKQKASYDENDYDYAVFPNEDAQSASAFLYLSPDPQLTLGPGAPRNRAFAPHIPASFKRTDDGYIYEVKFPAKYLRPAILKTGSRLGVGIFINDRDNEEGVESALTNTPDGTQCYNRPNLWPVMLLVE